MYESKPLDDGVDGKAAVARRCLRLLLRNPAARLAGPQTLNPNP